MKRERRLFTNIINSQFAAAAAAALALAPFRLPLIWMLLTEVFQLFRKVEFLRPGQYLSHTDLMNAGTELLISILPALWSSINLALSPSFHFVARCLVGVDIFVL